MVILACFAEENYTRDKKLVFEFDSSTECGRYLSSLRIREYWQPSFNRERLTRIDSVKTICLWKISAPNITQYADQIESLIDQKLGLAKNLGPFRTSLVELFNNVIDHAKSNHSGYVHCQFYESKQTLCLSVCDFGLGIPATLNKYWTSKGEERRTDAEALASAVRKGVTSQSTPKNKGYGLFNIRTLTGENNGSCLILSNSAILFSKLDGQLKTYPLDFKFPGTLVYVEVDTTQLPDKEKEITDEFEY